MLPPIMDYLEVIDKRLLCKISPSSLAMNNSTKISTFKSMLLNIVSQNHKIMLLHSLSPFHISLSNVIIFM